MTESFLAALQNVDAAGTLQAQVRDPRLYTLAANTPDPRVAEGLPMLQERRPDIWSQVERPAALEAQAADLVATALAKTGTDDHHFNPVGNRIIAEALLHSTALRAPLRMPQR